MSFKKFKMAAGRHFGKGAVAQIAQRYKNSIRSYFVQDHLNYQKMQKPGLPPSGAPSLVLALAENPVYIFCSEILTMELCSDICSVHRFRRWSCESLYELR